MITLFGASDTLRLVTTSAANLVAVCNFATLSGGLVAKAGSLLKWTRTK